MTDGDVLRLQDRITARRRHGSWSPACTGPRRCLATYWGLDDIAPSGSSTASGFTTYGPLAVQAAAFAGPARRGCHGRGSWLAQPQTASIPANQLTTVAANVSTLQQALQNAEQLPALTLTTSLPAVLNGTASDLDVARSLLAICAVLLFLLAAAALLAVARLLAGQREGESAMLSARGATRGQLVRLTAAEAIPLCVLSSAVGGVAGVCCSPGCSPGPAGRDRAPDRALGSAAPAPAAAAVAARGDGDHGGAGARDGDPGHGPGPPGQAGGHLRRHPGRRGPGPGAAGGARGLAAARTTRRCRPARTADSAWTR